MQKHKSIFHRILRAVGILALAAVGLLMCGWLLFRIFLAVTAPEREAFLQYARETYQKDFVFVREFTYSDYTYTNYIDLNKLYGLETSWPIRWCPAAELEDPEIGISFHVYASPFSGWHFQDDYRREVLLYCIKEQGIPLDSEPRHSPSLLLENSRDDAMKLQQMVVRFNEIYPGNKRYAEIAYDSEWFTVPGSVYAYQIHSGFYKDPRFDHIFYFCYDTPLEKYEAFLQETLG